MTFSDDQQLVLDLIEDIPDFPKPGVVFKDITPLLASPKGLRAAINALVALAPPDIDVVVGMEARGFLLAAPVALELGAGFVPVRKPGKLPAETIARAYDLEYGSNTLELHVDAIRPGQRVVLLDDLLATGGTAGAAVELIEALGGEIVRILFMIELEPLEGRSELERYDVRTLLKY